MTDYETIESLVPDFQYIDEDNNRIVLTVGFTATFYFWGGHTPHKRQALVECIEAFEAAYGEHLTWAFTPETRVVKLDENKLPMLRDFVKTLDGDDAIEWYLSSGEDDEAVGEFAISALTERGWEGKQISYLAFHVPRSHVFEDGKKRALEQLILLCHERLHPFHGNAGLTAIGPRSQTEWEPEEFDVTPRYNALYVEDRIGDSIEAPKGIKGINWLTFISNMLTERLGGLQAFVTYCRRFDVEPTAHGDGFIVRAGETPQLGPVGAPAPEAYVRANAALRPLRNGKFGSMGSGSIHGELRFDDCTSDLWIRRFDAPGIWPPKTFIGLPRTPLGKVPSKKIKLKTGDTCTVHGRYRHPGFGPMLDEEYDLAPQVVLLPGDMAPYHLNLGPHGEYLGRDAIKWELIAEL